MAQFAVHSLQLVLYRAAVLFLCLRILLLVSRPYNPSHLWWNTFRYSWCYTAVRIASDTSFHTQFGTSAWEHLGTLLYADHDTSVLPVHLYTSSFCASSCCTSSCCTSFLCRPLDSKHYCLKCLFFLTSSNSLSRFMSGSRSILTRYLLHVYTIQLYFFKLDFLFAYSFRYQYLGLMVQFMLKVFV